MFQQYNFNAKCMLDLHFILHEQAMENIDEFLKKSKDRLQKILNQLEWTEEGVLRDFNTNSVASLKENDITLVDESDEPLLPLSCAEGNSVVLGNYELHQLLGNPTAKAPEKFSDLQANFSREEKLVLYEHTVKHKSGNNFSPFMDDGLVSLADIVAMKKREKIKRRKYRISKPTQTEEVRSLVELQMQALKQYLSSKYTKPCKKESLRTSTHNVKSTAYKDSYLSNQYSEQPREHKKCNEQKRRNYPREYEKDRRNMDFQDKPNSDSYKKKDRSRSESRSKHRHKDRSQSRKRKKERHSKEKNKKRHKGSSHRSRS